MSAIKATWRSGHFVPLEPVDWPDGTEVRVEPLDQAQSEQDDDPASIERWIAEFEAIPPMMMSTEEEAAWIAARQAQRDFELANFSRRADHLRSLVE